MPDPILIQSKTTLPVAEIRADRRLRPVSEAGVEAILSSVAELGQIVTPLTVRQRHVVQGDGLVYELLDGAHRLEAARRLGHDSVPVRVFECTADQAALLEIDGNLAGAELNALDTAVFLATRKAVYERLHPLTKRGPAGAVARWDATDTMSVASFVTATAEKFGLSDRHVRRMASAGARLGPDEIHQLRLAPRPVTLADLQAISGIGEAPERYEVVRLLATGEARSAAAARKAWLHREHPPAPVDPVDAEYLALKDKWHRARKAARRRFVSEFFDELAGLVTDESAKHGDKAVFYNRALPFEDGADG